MLKRLIFGAGMAYMARRFMGNRRSSRDHSRRGSMFRLGGSRWGRRGMGW